MKSHLLEQLSLPRACLQVYAGTYAGSVRDNVSRIVGNLGRHCGDENVHCLENYGLGEGEGVLGMGYFGPSAGCRLSVTNEAIKLFRLAKRFSHYRDYCPSLMVSRSQELSPYCNIVWL